MRVKCTSELPTLEQVLELKGQYIPGRQVFHVKTGQEYIVYGLSLIEGVPWILYDGGFYLVPAPLCLFEIVDGRLPDCWVAGRRHNDTLVFWPPSFYREFYLDDLIEQVPEVVEDFQRIRANMEFE